MKKLLLIDGNSILNRAYFALMGRSIMSTKDGIFTNAIFGFLNTYEKFILSEKPTHVAVAFDLKTPTFRHEMYKDYKAGRRPMDDELVVQFPIIKEILDLMGIARIELPGYEADDIMGTIAEKASGKNWEVIVLTGDRDMMQIALGNCTVKIPTTSKGTTSINIYSEETIMQEFGIYPKKFIEIKALMGDKSDNIPGVAGIGPKTALVLIKEYGTLEKIYENIDNIKSLKQREKLICDKDNAFLSRKLAEINTKIPIEREIDSLILKAPDKEKLLALFEKLEFKYFIKKYNLSDKKLRKINPKIQRINDNASLAANKRIYVDCNFNEAGELTEFSYTTDGETIFVLDNFDLLEELLIKTNGISGHYLKKMLLYLMKKNIFIPKVNFDTAAAAYLEDALKDTYELNELCEKHLDVLFPENEEENYNSAKVYYLQKIMEKLIRDNNMSGLLDGIELPLIEVLAYMEYIGFKADKKFLSEFSDRLGKDIAIVREKIHGAAGEKFNVNSTKQMGIILFEKLGLPCHKKTKTGYSTSADVLSKLAVKYDIAKWVLEYRKLAKLKSTYADGLSKVIKEDGRIHSSFKQTVTATGRLSSTEPNLQNLPVRTELGREIRKAFIPENKDYLLTSADYSQIELRVLAHVSGDKEMTEAFLKNEDIHKQTAAKVFGVDDRFVTVEMRRAAKAVNFGIIYGISDFGLSKDLNVPIFTAKEYIAEYLNQYKGIKKYMKDIIEYANKKGYVKTIFERRRYIPELKSNNYIQREFGKRVALNAPIQGAAADIMKIAMIKVYNTLKDNNMKSRLILQVHDELVMETHIDEVDKIEDILRELMSGAVELNVPLVVDVKTGNSLFETK